MSVDLPVKILYEGLGHTVTIEVKSGDLYRGTLALVEDNMNCLIESVTLTSKDGKQSALEQVYVRGSQIRFFILPDMLRHAPMFKMSSPKVGGPTTVPGNRRAFAARAGSMLRGRRGK